jgi:hypothetical protein
MNLIPSLSYMLYLREAKSQQGTSVELVTTNIAELNVGEF